MRFQYEAWSLESRKPEVRKYFRITLVKFSKISPTRAGSYCQRTSYRKWPVLWKMQKFQIFTTNPLKMRACSPGRKVAEYDQRASASVFWPFGIWIQYIVWFLGIKFRIPRCFLWLFILNVIKIFCLDLSPGCVCFETFDYLRMPHQRAFDQIF
jgi:hypothetical protein